MLDSLIKPHLDKVLEKAGAPLSGFGPTTMTIVGFFFGLSGCFTIGMGNYTAGLILFFAGRMIDAIAARTPSLNADFADYLRVTLEWVLYAAFVFFFVLSQVNHSTGAVFLLLGYIMLAVSALAYKVIAAKRGQVDDETSLALFHPSRLVERTEILVFTVLCCLFPVYFSALAMLFGFLLLVTACGWIFKAKQNF
jgi:hypothetical protein